jgi:pilus assembly protein Flp/PilA
MNKRRGEEGQGLVEYALILVLCAVVVIVMLALAGPSLGGVFANLMKGYQVDNPVDVCPNTTINRQEIQAGYGKRNILIDYTNIQGDEVHLLYGQDTANGPFQMYSRDVDPDDNCKQ